MEDKKYTLEDVEKLREKTGVSYEEAVSLLDKYDGDLARALIELEKRGKLENKGFYINVDKNAASFLQTWWRRGCETRLLVERDGETLVNLSVLFMVLALLLGWRLVVVAAILALALGCRVKLRRPEEQPVAPEKSAQPAPEQAPQAEAAEAEKMEDDGYNSITIE
ncbi:MAG: DUF4342 domain-containing protein [Clostridia bacterium]|nr:DUF4342 domain-containing protein [Clostridia bacterium]